jgi:hypothetical protein
VRRKGFARKLGWVCYGTLRRVHVRLTNTRLANIPNYTHNAQGTQLCPILRAASDSTLILTARSRISRAKFFISSVQRCWESIIAANVQRQYAEDAKVETSFSALCGISRCHGTVGIVALIEGQLSQNPLDVEKSQLASDATSATEPRQRLKPLSAAYAPSRQSDEERSTTIPFLCFP